MDVFNHSFRKLYIKTINNLDPGLNLPRSNKSPIKKKTAPLKSATGELIQNRARQMERWVQHYSEEEGALDAIKCHQVPSCAGGAWQWSKPWIVKALDSLEAGKVAGNDSIPAEVLKCWKGSIISELHEILCGEKVKYHKTWGVQTPSPHSTRTKAIGVTAKNYRDTSLNVSNLKFIYYI